MLQGLTAAPSVPLSACPVPVLSLERLGPLGALFRVPLQWQVAGGPLKFRNHLASSMWVFSSLWLCNVLQWQAPEGLHGQRMGKLNLVDLAGTERCGDKIPEKQTCLVH